MGTTARPRFTGLSFAPCLTASLVSVLLIFYYDLVVSFDTGYRVR